MPNLLPDNLSRLMPALREILGRHGVTRAAFFGSVARGQETEQSDIDLLVEVAPGRSLLDQAALELDLVALFDREVEVVTYQSLDPRIRQQALHDQAPIL
ncbi:MAG TPA: nucleotidyltransferase family protein [Ktedonobacterales bacterium]